MQIIFWILLAWTCTPSNYCESRMETAYCKRTYCTHSSSTAFLSEDKAVKLWREQPKGAAVLLEVSVSSGGIRISEIIPPLIDCEVKRKQISVDMEPPAKGNG